MSRFDGLYSLSEAAEMLGIDKSVLRVAIGRGRFIIGEDVKLFSKQWVITDEAIEKYRLNHLRPKNSKNA